MRTPKRPVVYDPRVQKFFYDQAVGDVQSITTNPSGGSGKGTSGVTSIEGEDGVVTLQDI